MHKRVSSSLLAAGLLIGAVLAPPAFADISAATSAGQAAGGYGARDFNPQQAFEQTRRNMGMISADPSGRIGDEASVRVRQEQDRPFQCRNGAMATGGQLRLRVDECERNADGSLRSLSVSVCDAMMSGAPCHDHSFSPSRDIPPNATNEFSGGNLMGRYVIGAECDTDGCSMNVWQEHGELFEMDPWEMREQARERNRRLGDDSPAALVQGIREHESYEFVDSRSSPTAQPSGWMGERAHCLGGQFNQLFTEGDIPVTCSPDDPRSIVFLDPNGDGACTAEEIREERCVVDIPTHLTTCEPYQRECLVERPAEEFVCERRREVEMAGRELACVNQSSMPCVPGSSCCHMSISCNSDGTANLTGRTCNGSNVNQQNRPMEDFIGRGFDWGDWRPHNNLSNRWNNSDYVVEETGRTNRGITGRVNNLTYNDVASHRDSVRTGSNSVVIAATSSNLRDLLGNDFDYGDLGPQNISQIQCSRSSFGGRCSLQTTRNNYRDLYAVGGIVLWSRGVMNGSRVYCTIEGNCYIDAEETGFSNPGFYPRVYSWSSTRNIYEDYWVDSCDLIEERVPVD